jgi:hypothetical protein
MRINLAFKLKYKINVNHIETPSPYRAVNTLRLGYKTNHLMLCREIIAVCSEMHTKHTNTLCVQNVELCVKLVVHIVTTVRYI